MFGRVILTWAIALLFLVGCGDDNKQKKAPAKQPAQNAQANANKVDKNTPKDTDKKSSASDTKKKKRSTDDDGLKDLDDDDESEDLFGSLLKQFAGGNGDLGGFGDIVKAFLGGGDLGKLDASKFQGIFDQFGGKEGVQDLLDKHGGIDSLTDTFKDFLANDNLDLQGLLEKFKKNGGTIIDNEDDEDNEDTEDDQED